MTKDPENKEGSKGTLEPAEMAKSPGQATTPPPDTASAQAAAFERFLRDRRADKAADQPFSKRYKAMRKTPPEPPEAEEEAVLSKSARSAKLGLPFEFYGRDRGGRRRRRPSDQARIEVRGTDLLLTGDREEHEEGKPRKLRFLGVGHIKPSASIQVPHFEVDLDEGTLQLKVLPSRPVLRERPPDSGLARYCRDQLLGRGGGDETRSLRPAEGPEDGEGSDTSDSERPAEGGDASGSGPAIEPVTVRPKPFSQRPEGVPLGEDMLRDEAFRLVEAASRQYTFVQADVALDQVASYDYAAFEYLLEPEEGARGLLPESLSDEALELIDGLEEAGLDTLLFIDFFHELEAGVLNGMVDSGGTVQQFSWYWQWLLSELYCNEGYSHILDGLFRVFATTETYRQPGTFASFIAECVVEGIQQHLREHGYVQPTGKLVHLISSEAWTRDSPTGSYFTTRQYPFTVFTPHSVNLGLRLVYRQDWKLLGVQPGEVVKTIPLGPGQSMKISTKITRRLKTDLSRDTSQIVERTTESADTVKDSSEIVRETADAHNWEVAGEGSFGYGFGLISVDVSRGPSYAGETAKTSSDRATSLNEKVRKTASKTQSETRVHVATERQEAFETETATEIRNPNDEVAITYEYLHLQHLYETFTRLAEVDSVVFVAEDLPAPDEINAGWVRRYAWILARVLLDESFRPALEEIVNDNEADDPNVDGTTSGMVDMLSNAASEFAKFTGGGGEGGLTIPDIYGGAVKGYLDWAAEQHAIARLKQARDTRRERLFEHIRDNVLHYCRAIWTHEDVDQRILRYRKRGIQVPMFWLWAGAADESHPFEFSVVPQEGIEVPLERVIEPTPPIGFVGNYAIHRYRPLGIPDQGRVEYAKPIHIDVLMELLRGHYVDPTNDFAVLDPSFKQELQRAEVQEELTDDQVLDVVHYLPRLRDQLLDSEGNVRRQPLRPSWLLNPVQPWDWAEYCFRRRHSDRVLFASGNLYLDLRVGVGSAMESFKRLHRAVNVLEAIAHWHSAEIDTLRREMRLDAHDYEDPDIERMTIVRTDQPLGMNVDPSAGDDGD